MHPAHALRDVHSRHTYDYQQTNQQHSRKQPIFHCEFLRLKIYRADKKTDKNEVTRGFCEFEILKYVTTRLINYI